MASSDEKAESVDSDPDPDRGYRYLKSQGYSHDDIVDLTDANYEAMMNILPLYGSLITSHDFELRRFDQARG